MRNGFSHRHYSAFTRTDSALFSRMPKGDRIHYAWIALMKVLTDDRIFRRVTEDTYRQTILNRERQKRFRQRKRTQKDEK